MRKAFIAVFLCASSSAVMANPWVPDKQTISKLESALQMPKWGQSAMYPKGHVPAVTEFARYYTGDISNGHRMVLGELVGLGPNGHAGIHLVTNAKAFPMIADGGCYIVNVVYDVDAARVVSLKCNGMG